MAYDLKIGSPAIQYTNCNAYSSAKILCEVTLDSQSTDDLTSTCTVRLYVNIQNTAGYYNVYSYEAHISGGPTNQFVEDVNQSYTSKHKFSYGNSFIAGKKAVVGHDGEGNSTIIIYYSYKDSIGNDVSGNMTIDLPNIATKSTDLKLSSTSIVLGNTLTASVTKKGSTHKHIFRVIFNGNESYNLNSGYTTASSYTFTLPTSWANVIPSATSASIEVRVQTYTSGGTNLGMVNTTATATVPDYTPDCWVSNVDELNTSEINSSYSDYVIQNVSIKRVTFGYTMKYGATVSSFTLSAGGNTYNVNGLSTYDTSSFSNGNFYVTIMDSRGKSKTSAYVTKSFISFSRPNLSISATRTSETSSTGTVTYSATSIGSSTYTVTKNGVVLNSLQNKTFSGSTGTLTTDAGTVNYNQTYTFKLSVTNPYLKNAVESTYILSYGQPTLWLGKDTVEMPKMKLIQGEIGDRITSTNGSPRWAWLGTWSNTSDSSILNIEMYIGDGYNAAYEQNVKLEIFVKDGWQSTTSVDTAFGGVLNIYHTGRGLNTNRPQLKLCATAYNSVNVYFYSPWSHIKSDYFVKLSSGSIWTSMQGQTVTTFNGTEQNVAVKQLADIDSIYPVGSVYLTTTTTSPATLFGGTWTLLPKGYLYNEQNTNATTTFGSWTSGSTNLTVNQIPSHNHITPFKTSASEVSDYGLQLGGGFSNRVPVTGQNVYTTTNTGGGQGHTHSIQPLGVRVYAWYRTA